MHLSFKANVILLNSCFLKICSGLPFQSLLVSADRQASTRLDIVCNQQEPLSSNCGKASLESRARETQGAKARPTSGSPGPDSLKVASGVALVLRYGGPPPAMLRSLNVSQGFQHQNTSKENPDPAEGLCALFSLHPWKNLLQVLGSVMRENNEEMALTRHVHCIKILIFLLCVFYN